MKIVQINAVCDTGSTGRICRELNDYLIRHGHESIVLYGNGSSKYEFGQRVTGKLGVKAHALLSRVCGKNAAYSPIATRRILHTLRIYQPDVVHLHNLHGNFVSLRPLLRYLAKKDIPTVITLHDCWFFTGKCTHYTAAGCYRWQTGCHDCPILKSDIPSYLFDRTGEMWAEKKKLFQAIRRLAVVGVSDWITDEAGRSFLKDAKILRRIYNWIDLDVFYPRGNDARREFGIAQDKWAVLCIGAGWAANAPKTKDLLALALRLGDACQIVLAGNVDFADSLPANVRWVGYISDTDILAKLYSACDVYVHLSREDTFGKVIAEALACGTPAVVYNATACPEVIGEDCGIAVETGDLDGVCGAIEAIRRQGKAHFSRNCVQTAGARFAKQMLIEETLDLYGRLIAHIE